MTVLKHFGKKNLKFKSPEPNAGRVQFGKLWVEYKVCPDSCCKTDKKGNVPKTKHRWVGFASADPKDVQPVCMALSWEGFCNARGWEAA